MDQRVQEHGIDGIRARKPTGRPERKKKPAQTRMEEILKEDPQAFGFLKGRWVVRASRRSSPQRESGQPVYVHDMLKDMGLAYKRPKLTVKSDDPNYHRKKKEVRDYKRAASALEKKGSSSGSRTRPGPNSILESKPNG